MCVYTSASIDSVQELFTLSVRVCCAIEIGGKMTGLRKSDVLG